MIVFTASLEDPELDYQPQQWMLFTPEAGGEKRPVLISQITRYAARPNVAHIAGRMLEEDELPHFYSYFGEETELNVFAIADLIHAGWRPTGCANGVVLLALAEALRLEH